MPQVRRFSLEYNELQTKLTVYFLGLELRVRSFVDRLASKQDVSTLPGSST